MIDAQAAEPAMATDARFDRAAAFEGLYRTHARRIYSLACRFVGNQADAEEPVREIFLLAHRRLDSFRREAALSTWLHRLAVNRYLDHVRSRAAKQAAVTTALPEDRPAGPTRSASDPLHRMALERAITQLPDGYREVFVLHDVEGYEHRADGRRLRQRADRSGRLGIDRAAETGDGQRPVAGLGHIQAAGDGQRGFA